MRRAGVTAAAILACAACDKPAPRDLGDQPQAPATTAVASTSPAESLYFRGEYDSAAVKWRADVDSARQKSDSLREATALMWLGLTAWRQGDNAAARSLGERALEIKKRLRGNADLSRSYNALGLVARDEGRLRDAAILFDNAISSATAVADTAGLSRAAANLALIDLELGEFDRARKGFEAARDAGRALGDKRVEGNALNNLGMLMIRLGDAGGAIPMIQSALDRYRAIEYPTGEQNSLAQLATAYDLLGEPQRALALLDSASTLARAGDMRTEEASNLRLMGQLYQTLSDHRRALAFFAKALSLSRELGLEQEAATTLRSEAASHLSLGNIRLARERTLEALRIHRGQGAVWEELGDELMLAELAAVARDARDADARVTRASAIAGKLDVPSARAEVALTKARIAALNEDWKRVLGILDAARNDLRGQRADIAWEPLSLRARALGNLGRLDSAAQAGKLAIEAAERVRGRIASAGLRTGFTAARASIYADQVLVLLKLNRAAEAFEVADAARGRALVEHLSQARARLDRSPRTTSDIVKGETLLRQIDELVRLLEDAKRAPRGERNLDEPALEGISARIAAAEREYSSLVERVDAEDPERAMLLGVKTARIADIQKFLRPDEALVEYLVSSDRVLVFVARRHGLGHVEIPVGDSIIAQRVRFARELLARRDAGTGTANAALASLYELLFEPIENARMLGGVKRLVLVPHSSLSYLPFAALRSGKGKYLAQDYTLLTLPSAGAFAALRTRPDVSRERKVGAAVFAPFTNSLPATKSEAQSVRSLVGGTRALFDKDASESAFRRVATTDHVIHLATHGTLNVQNPLFSRIELARPRRGGASTPSDDGHLAVHELVGMRTGSPLVFLSGCETALGSTSSNDFVKGEDYATLSQAILYSGARSAVATLWRIDDESAAVFARHFYRHLQVMAPPEALAAAQQDMLIDRRYREPYHWAAYQVAGSGDRIPLQRRWWGLFAR